MHNAVVNLSPQQSVKSALLRGVWDLGTAESPWVLTDVLKVHNNSYLLHIPFSWSRKNSGWVHYITDVLDRAESRYFSCFGQSSQGVCELSHKLGRGRQD